MLKARYEKLTLHFKRPSGTSRGVLTEKISYLIRICDSLNPSVCGIGECSLIPGLSPDDSPDYESVLESACGDIEQLQGSFHQQLQSYPSIRFGIETALLDLKRGGVHHFFDSSFTSGQSGIPINGLIWMGNPIDMMEQTEAKLLSGFTCLKMKIGAIAIEQELSVLRSLRSRFPVSKLQLRVDANGAFRSEDAMPILKQLADLQVHSIEQPLAAGQWQAMADICLHSPIPVALDEELIGLYNPLKRLEMLSTIRPQYIILKPSLLGGFQASQEWIKLAESLSIGWWITSALESNVGLNAIAQWTSSFAVQIPQGLGTGALYTNNVPSKLCIRGERLWYDV